MIKKYWGKFNVLTKDHFYHNGANLENRREVVEALVCNFDINGLNKHNHGMKVKNKVRQLELELEYA
jgi:DNA adenine methylase